MNNIVEKIGNDKLIAIIREETREKAYKAAIACIEGGIKIVEITMNTPGVLKILEDLSQNYPDVLLGAGTVLSIDMADKAIQSGARFLVSPHTDKSIIDFCHQGGILACPGTATPTEMMKAHNYGADIIKVFPISNLGGPAFIQNIKGPLPHLKLMPTGGVDINNVQQFIRAGVFAVGLSRALVCKEAVETGDYHMIKRLAQEIIEKVIHT